MAEIAPNSVFKLLRGCPLDSDYTNSLWFSSSSAQYNYFNGLTKYTLSNQQYQRHSKGVIRVSLQADDLFDINYCMFQNTAFGNKWFYAFVTDVEYVNNQCTNVYYEIDVLQTYYFDYELGLTIVERETPASDEIGENVVPENLEIGELVPRNIANETWGSFNSGGGIINSQLDVALYTIPNQTIVYNPDIPEIAPNVIGVTDATSGIYTPCSVEFFAADNYILINASIISHLQKNDVIAGIFIVPHEYANTPGQVLQRRKAFTNNPRRPLEFHFNDKSYVPKNNKMFTYPYMQLMVSNHQGQSATYRWENFAEEDASTGVTFYITGSANPEPSYVLMPDKYMSQIAGNGYQWDNGISIGNLPTVTWSEDAYTTWKASKGTSFAISTVANSLSTVGNGLMATGMSKNPAATLAGTAISVGAQAANTFATITEVKNTPDSYKGMAYQNSALTTEALLGWTAYSMCIKPEMAEIVDGYFTRFGYATHKLKKPSLRNRQNWTYVKTIGCMIHAKSGTGLNAEAEKKICQIFDNGITFWTSGNIVGEYGLTNEFITK